MNRQSFTYELQIKAIIDDAERELKSFGETLQKSWESGQPPKHLLKTYENLRARLVSLQQIARKGTVDSSDLAIAQGDYKAFSKSIHDLGVEFKLFSAEQKKAMLSTAEQQALKDRIDAVEAYTAAIQKNERVLKERQPLEERQKTLETTQGIQKEQKGDLTAKLKSLKEQGGPSNLSKEAEQYLANQKELLSIKEQIAKAEKTIENEKARGTKDSGDNKLTRAKKTLDELKAKRDSIEKDDSGKQDYDSALEAYNTELKNTKDALDAVSTALENTDTELDEVNKKLKNLKTISPEQELQKLKDKLKELGVEGIDGADSIEQIKEAVAQLEGQALAKADKAIEKFTKHLDTLGAEANKAKKEIDNGTDSIKAQTEAASEKAAFEEKIKQFLGLSGAAQVLRRALNDAMATIAELDKTMTEMAVVTDLSVGDYWNQLPQYTKRANELGLAINDVYQADTLFYQQGLKTNEVVAISTETMKMARIAGIDTALATDRMTAALRGFNMELDETSAQKIADVYSQLAAITAADVKEISAAMTKTASIASSAGMEFETTAAFLSQIIETTRESAETAGTAMKTVIARFQELKKDPKDIGEVDGEIVDANAIETALRSVGVSLRDSSGQFRELDEVFLELSSKWDGLDKNTQRYIATIAAGSRQQSRFIAMMQDYGRTQELVSAANNSAGASQEQFAKTMESLEAKVEKLKNAWHEFTMGIMNSDLVKFGVDVLTKFLEVVNNATGALDGVGGSLTKIVSVVGIFKLGKQIFDKFMPTISGFFTNVTKEAYTGGLNAGKAFQQGLKDSKEQNIGSAQDEETEGKKSKNKEDVKRTGWEKLGDKTIGLNKWQEAGKHSKNRKKELEELNKLKKGTKEYEEQQNKVLAEGKKQWDAYGKAVGSVGQTLTGVGMGMSAIGGILSSLGLEEAGEAFTTLGNGAMIAGAALMGVAQVLQYIPILLNVIMAHPIIAIIVIALTVILAKIIAIVAAINDSSPEAKLKKAQEAAEQAAEAAERASESYNNLKNTLDDLGDKYKTLDKLTRGTEEWNEAVQDINGTVLELIQKYPQLADFLKAESGVLTLDIDSAGVQEVIIQAQVASIVTQDSAKRAEQKVMAAQKVVDIGNSTGVSALAEKRRGEVFWHDTGVGAAIGAASGAGIGAGVGAAAGAGTGAILSAIFTAGLGVPVVVTGSAAAGAGIGTLIGTGIGGIVGTISGAVTGTIRGEAEANAVKSDKELQKNIAEASKKLAAEGKTASYNNLLAAFTESGISPEDAEILATEYAKDGKAFIKLGQELVAYDEQMKAFSTAMAESAKTLVKMPEVLEDNIEGQNTFWNTLDAVLDETDYQRFYEEEMAKIESGTVSLTEEDKKRFVEQVGGKGAKLENGKIVDSNGETLVENADEAYFKSLLAEEKATKRFASAGDTTYNFLRKAKTYIPDDVASDDLVERLFSNKDGEELYEGEAQALANIDVSTLWETLTSEERDLFGSKQGLKDYINNAITKSQEAFRDSLGFEGVTARAAKNLTNITKETEMSDPEAFTNAFNTALQSAENTEDAEIFKQLVGSIDPESAGQREVWEQKASNLEAQGVTLTQGMQAFFTTALTQTEATYSNEWLSGMGVSKELISQYQAALTREDSTTIGKFHGTFKKWRDDYDTVNSEAAKAEHELLEQTIEAIIENREKQIEAYEDATNAQAEANSNLITKISDNVARLRELREEEETKKAITDNLSKQVYLGMDTSGGNALELLRLQEENEQMTQDYEDQLVDQAINRLEEDNQKALEQRERQIELMRQQLDIYSHSDQIQQEAKAMIEKAKNALINGQDIMTTELGVLLTPETFTSAFEESTFWNGLRTALSKLVPTETLTGEDGDGGSGDGGSGGGGSGGGNPTEQIKNDARDAITSAYSDYASGEITETKMKEIVSKQQNKLDNIGASSDYKKFVNDAEAKVLENQRIGPEIVATSSYKYRDGTWELDLDESQYGTTEWLHDVRLQPVADPNSLTEVFGEPSGNYFVKKGDKWYAAWRGGWYTFPTSGNPGKDQDADNKRVLAYLNGASYANAKFKFETGGLADFTGPAWLDGTPSKPEYILNAKQTERFFTLVDVLEGIDREDGKSKSSGDNYFDISINVEKIDNDYDVEQIASKIRSMIYDDATYRNVNAINNIR